MSRGSPSPAPARVGEPARLDEDRRRAVWRAAGATERETDELIAYAASPLHSTPPPARHYPLPDAACVAAWERYAAAARAVGADAVLRRVFVQLRFPVRPGASADPTYLAATRRGVVPDDDPRGLVFARPDALQLFLHPTPAGRVPAILAEDRRDFEALVQAITRRNEPDPIPVSMGACMVSGYNNWDRVAEHRRAFATEHPEDRTGEAWAAAFQDLVPQPDLYQDRFMLLSSGPYSSVPAAAIPLPEAGWRTASIQLRLEHECTHYFTRQALGTMRKSLLDELVADYMGMVEALGRFDARVFLHFMGLEAYPRYREGGRLQNYRGSPPLSPGAFAVLPSIARRAAESLEARESQCRPGRLGMADKARMIIALLTTGLEGLASEDAPALLAASLSPAAADTIAATAS
jgi:hypothetical protein